MPRKTPVATRDCTPPTSAPCDPAVAHHPVPRSPITTPPATVRTPRAWTQKRKTPAEAGVSKNAPRRTRTFDPLIKSQLLYQLS